jgi:hypothetical protein
MRFLREAVIKRLVLLAVVSIDRRVLAHSGRRLVRRRRTGRSLWSDDQEDHEIHGSSPSALTLSNVISQESTMKRVAQFALAAIVAVGLAAFPTTVGAKGQKKAGGGSHSMTGCLQKGDDANAFKLTKEPGEHHMRASAVKMVSTTCP